MIRAYRILTLILYPFLFLFLFYRILIKKEDPKRFKEKILSSHFNIKKKNNSKLIWFHAASIGELKSIIPIIEQLNNKNENLNFLITTTTLSSGRLAENDLKRFNNIEHRYFPFDISFLIGKFLNQWKPDRIFIVDSEIWPNLILKAKQFKIPIALINARITARSFNRWMSFLETAKKIFGVFDLCLCCNSETKSFLKSLNARNIHFKGNIKLIGDINPKEIKNNNERFLQKNRFWLAASTHEGEEIFCLNTHIKLKKRFKDIKTIIVPRHVFRVNKIRILIQKLKLSFQILNENESILENKEIIIINHFGVLNNYFKYAKSVYMGKSMIKRLKSEGGQNPLEAAKLQCKIYHGPYVYNFDDIYKILEANNLSKKINNSEELSHDLALDLENPYKKSEISNIIKNLGQTTLIDTMRLIENFLYNDNK